MYENLNACTLLFHVFSCFLQFSRNHLAGDESLPGDSSCFWVIGGSRDGTAWRHGLNRQVTLVGVPSCLGFMKGLAVTNTRQATRATFGSILMFHKFLEVFDWRKIAF